MHAFTLKGWLAAVALSLIAIPSSAQDTRIKFQLDWRFEGPAALFLVAKSKGYFAQEKLDVTIDAGSGSGNAVNRVASGAYEMGFADMAALMEFVGNNAAAPSKPAIRPNIRRARAITSSRAPPAGASAPCS